MRGVTSVVPVRPSVSLFCGMVEGRFTDHIAVGVLKEAVPRDVVDDVLAETGHRENGRGCSRRT